MAGSLAAALGFKRKIFGAFVSIFSRFLSGSLVTLCMVGPGCVSTEPDVIIDDPDVPPYDIDASWSADGRWLAVYHYALATGWEIDLVDLPSGGRRVLVWGGWGPDWSPDGAAIAHGFGYSGQIFRFDLSSGQDRQLTFGVSFGGPPVWHPAGAAIGFYSEGGTASPPGLWLMDTAGTAMRRLPLDYWGRDFDWSPDGDRLVLGGIERLVVSDTLGIEVDTLPRPRYECRAPAWSPSGQWIAYDKSPLRATTTEVWLSRPDGTEDHRVVVGGFHPTWSPDGRWIAFSMATTGEVAIWAVDTNGANLRRLTWPVGDSPSTGPAGSLGSRLTRR